jgi:hypothetical protein
MKQEHRRIFDLSVHDQESESHHYIWTRRNIWQKDFDKLVKSCIREIVSAELKQGEEYFHTYNLIDKVYNLLIAKHGFLPFTFNGTFSTYDYHISGLGDGFLSHKYKANREYFNDQIKGIKRDLGISASTLNRIIAMNKKRELKERQEQKKEEEKAIVKTPFPPEHFELGLTKPKSKKNPNGFVKK